MIINCETWEPVFLLVSEMGKSILITDFSCQYVRNIYFFPQLSALACEQGYLCLRIVFNAHPSDFVTQWGSQNNTPSYVTPQTCKYSKVKAKCTFLKIMARLFPTIMSNKYISKTVCTFFGGEGAHKSQINHLITVNSSPSSSCNPALVLS